MNRAEIYRVRRPPGNDPKRSRCFVIVFTLDKSMLTDFVAVLSAAKLRQLRTALRIAQAVE